MMNEVWFGGYVRTRWNELTRMEETLSPDGVVESEVPLTPEQSAQVDQYLTDRDRQSNKLKLAAQGGKALVDNALYLAKQTPTQAEVVAQVRKLTQQNNAIIRLVLEQFDEPVE